MSTVTMPIAFIKAEFNGRDGTGQVSVPGVKVGDAVIMTSQDNHERNPFTVAFEKFVTVDDEIHQYYSGDWTGDTFVLLLIRGV